MPTHSKRHGMYMHTHYVHASFDCTFSLQNYRLSSLPPFVHHSSKVDSWYAVLIALISYAKLVYTGFHTEAGPEIVEFMHDTVAVPQKLLPPLPPPKILYDTPDTCMYIVLLFMYACLCIQCSSKTPSSIKDFLLDET